MQRLVPRNANRPVGQGRSDPGHSTVPADLKNVSFEVVALHLALKPSKGVRDAVLIKNSLNIYRLEKPLPTIGVLDPIAN